jgi:hypothetical protein
VLLPENVVLVLIVIALFTVKLALKVIVVVRPLIVRELQVTADDTVG